MMQQTLVDLTFLKTIKKSIELQFERDGIYKIEMTLNVQPIDDITLRGIQSFISFIVCIIFINNF